MFNRGPETTWRRDALAYFRMTAGHDYLQSHLHKIGMAEDPMCELCILGRMDGDDLHACHALADIKKQVICKRAFKKKSNLY